MVNAGTTDSTERFCVVVCVAADGAVAVIVTAYRFGAQLTPGEMYVFTVTDAPFGGVTVVGLTRQPAFPFAGAGNIEQLKLTDPVKPFSGESVKFAVAVPPGSTAPNEENADICSVKSVCAIADAASATNTASTSAIGSQPRTPLKFKVDFDTVKPNLDRNDSDLTCPELIMSGFCFKAPERWKDLLLVRNSDSFYLRFIAQPKGCPDDSQVARRITVPMSLDRPCLTFRFPESLFAILNIIIIARPSLSRFVLAGNKAKEGNAKKNTSQKQQPPSGWKTAVGVETTNQFTVRVSGAA
jgi:hypothetical protein